MKKLELPFYIKKKKKLTPFKDFSSPTSANGPNTGF